MNTEGSALTATELRYRAQLRTRLCSAIRTYFSAPEAHALEVDTPALDVAGNTDPSIESYPVLALDGQRRWLRTSPEFFHKRLLCAGFGDLFEFAKVFRDDERSKRHRGEFTLLEYYRVDYTAHGLMDDMFALFNATARAFSRPQFTRRNLSYRDWFSQRFQLDVLRCEVSQLQQLVAAHGAMHGERFERDQCLDFLRSHVLEPELDAHQEGKELVFIYDFPASQAALARVHASGETAARFEVFCGGMELANGYHELSDAREQQRRFERDLRTRAAAQQPEVAMDTNLLRALETGLPDCSGVAIGLERWLMVLANRADIGEVLLLPD